MKCEISKLVLPRLQKKTAVGSRPPLVRSSAKATVTQGLKYCAVIHNMCSDNLRLCSDKGLFVQIQERDYATTYKLTRIAPFYSNMQKEQTTALFLVFLTLL